MLRGIAGAACVAAAGRLSAAPKPDKRPNILFIMSDDHSCNTIGAYGSKIGKTPNIDRLAKQGALLLNSFCANSICSPSRASILTGLHSHKNGVTHNGATWKGKQTVYSRLLGNAGYDTALIGKWHQKPPTPTTEVNYWEVLFGHGGQGTYHDPLMATAKGQKTYKGYSTDIIATKAIDWLARKWDQAKPFMLMAQFKAPHVPRQPPERHFNTYPEKSIPLPETFFDDFKGRAPYADKAWMKVWDGRPAKRSHYPRPATDEEKNRWSKLGPQQRKWAQRQDRRNIDYHKRFKDGEFTDGRVYAAYRYRRDMQDYLGCVSAVDDNVGRLVDWIDKQGLGKETIVVYCSDQSYFIGEHGWMEKRWMYEEGLRMPFILRWTGKIYPETEIKLMVQNIDYAPTFLAAAGVEIPPEMDGMNMLPLLQGQCDVKWRDAIYYHYYHHGAHNVPRHDGVRTDRYKLICYYTEDVYEMFDLDEDPNELKSVHNDPKYAEIRKKLNTRLLAMRRDLKVPKKAYRHPYVHLSRAEREAMKRK